MGLEPIRTNVHWILSPTCLPIPPLELLYRINDADKKNADLQRFLSEKRPRCFGGTLDLVHKNQVRELFALTERKKGFEPSTSTLAR